MFISPFLRCPSCNCIVNDAKMSLTSTGEPCPNGKKVGEYREIWPSLFGNAWIEAIYEHPLNDTSKRNMMAVLLCATLEVLLEKLLEEILVSQNANIDHIDILLNAHDGRERKGKLFKLLTKKSLKEALHELGIADFYDSWNRVVESRNKFVHGQPSLGFLPHQPVLNDLEIVRDKTLIAFYLLHNRYAANVPLPCRVST